MAVDPSKRIPTASSTDYEWIGWHKQLKKVFGKKMANDIWLYAWSKRGGIDAKANTVTLSNYLEKQGIDIERSRLDNLGEDLSDAADSFVNFTKWLIIIPLGIAGVVLIAILVKLIRDPKSTVGQAAMFTPQGRGLKAGKSLKGLK